jgi:hypothetical protein
MGGDLTVLRFLREQATNSESAETINDGYSEEARGRRRRTDRKAYAIVIELVLVIIAVVLVAMFLVGAVWVLIALSH